MNIESVISLIKAVSDANITNFNMEEGNFKLSMDKNKAIFEEIPRNAYPIRMIENKEVPMESMISESYIPYEENVVSNKSESVNTAKSEVPMDLKEVKSPIVGTYYSASGPDSPDFVKVGDHVTKGQTLCIIEAMKLMNDIESDFDGEIVEILVKNEQMVEFNQTLFRMK